VSQNAPQSAPDVITLITADHREVERIFELLRDDAESRPQAVTQLRALMLAHSEAEEAVVYTALKPEMTDEQSDETDGDVIDEAFDEHAQMEQLIEELTAIDTASAEFESLLMDVMEAVTHHVEEEESELLPKLREVASDEEMQRITLEFHRLRMQVLEEEGGADLGLPAHVLDPMSGVQDVDLREESGQQANR
jgi:hemerythrin superfamily protein